MGSQASSTSGLLFLSPLTLLVGVAIAGSEPVRSNQIGLEVLGPAVGAALSPMVAAGILRFAAPSFDRTLIAISGMLTAMSLSALLVLGQDSGSDLAFFESIAIRHAIFVVVGFGALTVGGIAAKQIDHIARYPFTLLALALGLTAVTILLGEATNGARLWLRVGPIRFQPSEVARFLLAAFAAVYIYERRHLIASSWRVRRFDLPPAPYLIPLAGAFLAAAGALVLQNDLGMAALVVLGALASLLGVWQARVAIGSAVFALMLAAGTAYLSVPRVQDRVAGWIDPWRDPVGRGFQFVRAEYALASGGIAGLTPGGTAAAVPEVHTDFIFVAIGAEFGWLGALAVLASVAMLICRCVLIALRVHDGFRALLAVGMGALLAIQSILIIGGTLRVLPLTGLTLPLVSYGGTSMVATLFVLGIVGGIGAYERKTGR